MTIVSMKEYYETIARFVNKHEINKVETSPMNNNQWYKDYLGIDGSAGKEVNRVVYETVEVEVKGLRVSIQIKLLETEWFDTDNGKSIFMYQKY